MAEEITRARGRDTMRLNGSEPIGPQLRKLRRWHDVTQAEMAERMGVKQPQVSAWETGARSPGIATLERYAAALGYTLTVRFKEPQDSPAMTWSNEPDEAPNGVLLAFWDEGWNFSRYHVMLHSDGVWKRWPVRSDKEAPTPDRWALIPRPPWRSMARPDAKPVK